MIVLNLHCRQQHRFEGWFASPSSFEDQLRRGLLTCPVCNSAEVSRLPSGPHVISSARADRDGESPAAVQQQLLAVVKDYLRNSENVGARFPEEARKIHYEEVPARNIRGIASIDEARELLDEGISVVAVPFPSSDETH